MERRLKMLLLIIASIMIFSPAAGQEAVWTFNTCGSHGGYGTYEGPQVGDCDYSFDYEYVQVGETPKSFTNVDLGSSETDIFPLFDENVTYQMSDISEDREEILVQQIIDGEESTLRSVPEGGSRSFEFEEGVADQTVTINNIFVGEDIILVDFSVDPNVDVYQPGMKKKTTKDAGLYRIRAEGAKGGQGSDSDGGEGAIIEATYTIESDETLYLSVGQTGARTSSSEGGGGGGGSFVAMEDSDSEDILFNDEGVKPLLIAGGGGGGSANSDGGGGIYGNTATWGTENVDGQDGGGTGGQGGERGGGISDHCANGGGGFLTEGQDGCYGTSGSSEAGQSFLDGSLGGTSSRWLNGGYGSASGSEYAGSAGGGYSGGQGGDRDGGRYGGGAGGSFIAADAQDPGTSDGGWDVGSDVPERHNPYEGSVENLGEFNNGQGMIEITKLNTEGFIDGSITQEETTTPSAGDQSTLELDGSLNYNAFDGDTGDSLSDVYCTVYITGLENGGTVNEDILGEDDQCQWNLEIDNDAHENWRPGEDIEITYEVAGHDSESVQASFEENQPALNFDLTEETSDDGPWTNVFSKEENGLPISFTLSGMEDVNDMDTEYFVNLGDSEEITEFADSEAIDEDQFQIAGNWNRGEAEEGYMYGFERGETYEIIFEVINPNNDDVIYNDFDTDEVTEFTIADVQFSNPSLEGDAGSILELDVSNDVSMSELDETQNIDFYVQGPGFEDGQAIDTGNVISESDGTVEYFIQEEDDLLEGEYYEWWVEGDDGYSTWESPRYGFIYTEQAVDAGDFESVIVQEPVVLPTVRPIEPDEGMVWVEGQQITWTASGNTYLMGGESTERSLAPQGSVWVEETNLCWVGITKFEFCHTGEDTGDQIDSEDDFSGSMWIGENDFLTYVDQNEDIRQIPMSEDM